MACAVGAGWSLEAAAEQPQGSTEEPAEVVVVGQRSMRSSRDPSAASRVLRSDELSAPGAAATDVLPHVPGVEVARSGARSDRATLSIRGSTAAQVPVYLGPFRLNDEITGGADLGALPLWMLDRIEVFRGMTPADSDSFGLGGAVYFEPKLPRGNALRAGTAFGSHGERSLWGNGSVSSGPARPGAPSSAGLFALRLSKADNDYDYQDDGGTAFDPSDDQTRRRANADFRDVDAWAIGVTRFSGGARVLSVVNAFEREQGVTGLAVLPAGSARASLRRLLAGVSSMVPCGNKPRNRPGSEAESDCSIHLHTQWLSTQELVRDPQSEIGLGVGGAENRGGRLSQRLALHGTLGVLRLGAQADLSRDQLEVTSAGRHQSERLSLRPSLRASAVIARELELAASVGLPVVSTRSSTGAPADVLEPEARAGAAWQVTPELAFLLNLGHFTRRPTLGELFGLSALVRGNEELSAERGEAADVGVRVNLGSRAGLQLEADAFAFGRRSRELIAYRRSSFGVVTPFNVGQAEVLGVELGSRLQFERWVRLDVGMTLQEPRDVTEGSALANDLLPYHSRFSASSRLAFYRDSTWANSSWELALASQHRSSKFADRAGLIVIPEQTRFDLELSSSFAEQALRVGFALRNLFSARDYDLLGQPLPGRTLHGSVELGW